MGNCQTVDAAALVIQHQSGRQERMYWPVTASEVMKMNPGHFVSLVIPSPTSGENSDENKTVGYTRVKLLRPVDTLVLGRAYRLVTTQEVMKVLKEKKKNKSESDEYLQTKPEKQNTGSQAVENNNEAVRQDRHQRRTGYTNSAPGRPKSWRPSLQSISESSS
ncbi:hypothetical protein OROMI_010186 [Orobanche minor]